MEESRRCPTTGQPIFFRLHQYKGRLCPQSTIMPPNCDSHTHCGRDNEANSDCTLCSKISDSRQCPHCKQLIEIFSQYANILIENDVGENEIPVEHLEWDYESQDIVIRPEFIGVKIGSSHWKKKLFEQIKDCIIRGNVKIKVYTGAHCRAVERVIDSYEKGFLQKLEEGSGNRIIVEWNSDTEVEWEPNTES